MLSQFRSPLDLSAVPRPPQHPLVAIVEVLTAGACDIAVHKGATALDDVMTITTAAAVGAVFRTDLTDATGDDLFVAGDTISLVSDGVPTAGEAAFYLEVMPMNMQVA